MLLPGRPLRAIAPPILRRWRPWRTRLLVGLVVTVVYFTYDHDEWFFAERASHWAPTKYADTPLIWTAPAVAEPTGRWPYETPGAVSPVEPFVAPAVARHEPGETVFGSSLVFGSNGSAYGWQDGDARHPVEQLVMHAQDKWNDLLDRQSTTLDEAVRRYRQRYGREPPRGFDRWWAFAVEHDVQIKDDYDQIFKDTSLFWALSPAEFRARARQLKSSLSHSYEINIDPHGETTKGGNMEHARSSEMRLLLEGIAPYLPASTEILVSLHDLGSTLVGHDQRAFLEGKVDRDEYASNDELRQFNDKTRYRAEGVEGVAIACPRDSPAWERAKRSSERPWVRPIARPADEQHPSFIHGHRETFDYCYNTDLLEFHGEYSYDHARDSKLEPVFQQSKLEGNGDLLLTPLDYYKNASHPESVSAYVPWSKKTVPKMFWRGSMTGDHYDHRKDHNWRNSHRIRLHTKAHETEGKSVILVQDDDGLWYSEQWPVAALNEAYMDVGLTGRAFQCNREDGTCDELTQAIQFANLVPPSEAAKFKYAVDVDGNGWSARFHRLLLSGAVIFKSTVNPEWFSDWLVPWYHYVVTYSELYTTMSYFVGPPGRPEQGHDETARNIGENGRDFRLRFWRWEDMQSYMLRLLLEYIRLEHDDRNEWNYRP